MTDTTKPFHLIEEEVAAFNARDLDRFVATFSEDAVLEGPAGADGRISGHDGIRAHFAEQMSRPSRSVEVLSRVALGSWIVDHEIVYEEGRELEQLAIYQLRDGKIANVDVLRPLGVEA